MPDRRWARCPNRARWQRWLSGWRARRAWQPAAGANRTPRSRWPDPSRARLRAGRCIRSRCSRPREPGYLLCHRSQRGHFISRDVRTSDQTRPAPRLGRRGLEDYSSAHRRRRDACAQGARRRWQQRQLGHAAPDHLADPLEFHRHRQARGQTWHSGFHRATAGRPRGAARFLDLPPREGPLEPPQPSRTTERGRQLVCLAPGRTHRRDGVHQSLQRDRASARWGNRDAGSPHAVHPPELYELAAVVPRAASGDYPAAAPAVPRGRGAERPGRPSAGHAGAPASQVRQHPERRHLPRGAG